jgi:hypothetical protein
MGQQIKQRIQSFLPFKTKTGAWRRIEGLDAENAHVVSAMMELADYFKQVIAEPREIYLSVQEVRSLTVYVRWRRKGVRGKQAYLSLNSIDGKDFLLRQSQEVQQIYRCFNQWALDFNLAHSLRLNEIRRLKKYLQDGI